MKKRNNINVSSRLRQIAEKLLNEKGDKVEVSFSEADKLKLIHQLRVHQIELELQNEELTVAKETAELAERKFTEFYDFSPSGYLSLTKSGEITDLNISTERLLERKRSSLIKSRFGFLVSIDMRSDYNNFLQKVFETKLKQTCELKLEIDDDTIKYVLVNGILSKIAEKCLITLTDITSYKQVENEMINAKWKAEENDRLKSAFLANMSHEIRTPMNGILGFTELLKSMDLTGTEKQNYIQIIEKSGNRMLNIINDIVDISRIEAQQIEVVTSNINVSEQLDYIYNFFKPEAEQKSLRLTVKNSLPENEAFISTDCEKVFAVLTNLVKNAIKYTKSGFVELGCEVKGDFLEFYVKDSGAGIPDEQKDFIFERFRQGNDSLNRNYEGSGLGLAISKAYVEMLGGRIWVESSPDNHRDGEGSTFRFTLPNLRVVEKVEELQTVVAEEIMLDSKLKFLVVDDDETSRILAGLMLKTFNGQIIQVTSGHEAVVICRNTPDIDLILMDIHMPGMDGYETTRQIRSFNKEVIIIAQTAFALNGDREDAINAGCNNYISKPINRKELLELVSKHLS